MTATDELRRMLDERGIDWGKTSYGRGTVWDGEYGTVVAVESGEVLSMLYDTDPEQAIEATLGRGTCHDEGDPGDFFCSECGVRMFTETNDTYTMIASDERTIIKHPNFCPNCGRRVVAGDA